MVCDNCNVKHFSFKVNIMGNSVFGPSEILMREAYVSVSGKNSQWIHFSMVFFI